MPRFNFPVSFLAPKLGRAEAYVADKNSSNHKGNFEVFSNFIEDYNHSQWLVDQIKQLAQLTNAII